MSDEVTTIVSDLRDLAGAEDGVTVGDVSDFFGARGVGPLILIPALLGASPLGGIPTFPTLMALIIAIFAVQILMGYQSLWLPQMARSRSVDGRVKRAADKLKPAAGWIDSHFGHRLERLAGDIPVRIAAGVIVGLCLLVPPAELVPFAAFVPLAAITCLALAIILRDGILMLVGGAAACAAAWFSLSLIG